MINKAKQIFIKMVLEDFLCQKFAYSKEEIKNNLKLEFLDDDYSIEFLLENRHSQQIDLYDIVNIACKYSNIN